ncbi:MAG TPA: hypothetical protein VGQ92_01785 [Actinoplanes sp.]|nr:hypothetical protein [Actinoplanes sp.]
MEFLRLLLRYLHLVAFALLFGAWVAQYLTGKLRVNVIMRTGLGTMIGTGLLLAIPFPSGVDLDYVKLGVKLVIALGIGALFGVATTRERAEKAVTRPLFLSIGGLALVNAAVAVFWR